MHCLAAFEALARLGTVARAARELGVSRSALSHSIGLLEHRLQTGLILRYSPAVQLSSAGRTYYEAVHQFVRGIAEGLYELSESSRIPLRLSVSPGMSRLWLSGRLPAFRARHPRIDLSLTVTEGVADVLGHQTDVAIRYGGLAEPGTTSVGLWEETVAPVAAPALAADCAASDLARLVHGVPLLEHRAWAWRDWLARLGRDDLAPAAPVLAGRDLILVLEAAAAGQGVALAPMRLAAPYLKAGRLRRAHASVAPGKPYHAVTASRHLGRPAVSAFLHWLAREAAADAALGGNR
ncbi:transcriptional regulator GcvA [Pigmentiphaga soli]|uniref:Transcriptional regulator GcvA n=2 Tax=Pigmentiphaga soli TaxID=1007095 RepID=A0ABP8GF70_9BURK